MGRLGLGPLKLLLILGVQLLGLQLLLLGVFSVVLNLRRAALHHLGDGLKEEML